MTRRVAGKSVHFSAANTTNVELDTISLPGYRMTPRPWYYRPAQWLVGWVMDRLSTYPLARWDWAGAAYQWVGAHLLWHVADVVEHYA